jgi:hypothetical protein
MWGQKASVCNNHISAEPCTGSGNHTWELYRSQGRGVYPACFLVSVLSWSLTSTAAHRRPRVWQVVSETRILGMDRERISSPPALVTSTSSMTQQRIQRSDAHTTTTTTVKALTSITVRPKPIRFDLQHVIPIGRWSRVTPQRCSTRDPRGPSFGGAGSAMA